MCCHTLEELALADRVAWLTDAGLTRFGTPDALRHELVGDYRLAARCDDEAAAHQLAAELARPGLPGRRISIDGTRCVVAGPEPLADLARTLVDRPGVRSVESGRSSLSDLLRHCAREA